MSEDFFDHFPLREPSWRSLLASPDLAPARAYILQAIADEPCLPPRAQVFAALEATPLAAVRVLVIGQDPYPTPGDAHGLAFSVEHGRPPRSLQNIFTEIQRDLGGERRRHANLMDWARQGVLLLNTVLTTPPGSAGGHRRCGWQKLTAAIIKVVMRQSQPLVVLAWGGQAQIAFRGHSVGPRQLLLSSGHPSPLAYNRPNPNSFKACGHFARCNAFLREHGAAEIAWTSAAYS